MRRSNSLSSIPLKKVDLFGSRGSRTGRSQSSIRPAERDSIASTSHLPVALRKSSLDRKSNNPSLSRHTPLTRPGTSRAGSLARTTPTTSVRTGSSRTTTPRPTIQKLANDKQWISQKYAEVQYFIATSHLFEPTFLNTNTLKPPTIKVFVFITATLFKEIFPWVHITNENYKEVIPTQLKVLHYPGTLTNSLLKTVNTMHSWPQIIGMWSWLIDKLNLTRLSDDMECLDYLEPEERQNRLLVQICQDFLVKRYELFNMVGNNDEMVKEANDQYVKSLLEILEVNFDEVTALQKELLEKSQFRDKQLQDVENLKAKKQRMLMRIAEMRKEIEDFEEYNNIQGGELVNEIQLLQSNIHDLKEGIDATRGHVQLLEEEKKVQPCTYQENLEMLREIAEFKNNNKIKKEKVEHAAAIKNKFDYQLTNAISKIQHIVIQWNRSLMEVAIEKPELTKLYLRERGFHDPAFLDELQEVLDYKLVVEDELNKALVQGECSLSSMALKKQELEEAIEDRNQILIQSKQELVNLKELIAKTKMDIKDVMGNTEERRREYVEHMQKLVENNAADIAVQTAEIKQLNEVKGNLEIEVKTFGQKMLNFFYEMDNQVVNNISRMDGMLKRVVENAEAKAKKVIELQIQLLAELQFFNVSKV